jgi:hypothetical protein
MVRDSEIWMLRGAGNEGLPAPANRGRNSEAQDRSPSGDETSPRASYFPFPLFTKVSIGSAGRVMI